MTKDFRMKQFAAGSCYSYILSSAGDAMAIDPHISLLKEYGAYLEKNRLKLAAILDTHTHADHFSLAAVLKKEYSAPALMHEKAVSRVADRRLKDNDEVAIGASTFEVFATPGHTDDAISIYGEGRIFTGDVVLIGSAGRTDFQNGSPESMFDTLQKIKSLPGDTLLFPGHDYHAKKSSTLSVEKRANPFLREVDKETFVKNMRAKVLPKPFNIDNIIRVNQRGEAVALEMISPRAALELAEKNAGVKLLDVRSSLEHVQVHIANSLNIPIDVLMARLAELNKGHVSYVVFCRTGNRSPMAADMLMQSGIQNVKIMEGGLLAWQSEHLPVIKGEGGISLERQIRVAAGSIMLAGIILSWLIHPAFIIIALLVSCGLIYAGLTDNCLMGMLMMKLPYNKNLYKVKLSGGTCSIGG